MLCSDTKMTIGFIADALTTFVCGKSVGLRIFYVRLVYDEVSGTRRKRSTGSFYSASALAYAPRVWNATLKQWVPSADVEVCDVITFHL